MTRKISKVGASLLVLAAAMAIGGCTQSEAKTTGKVVYQETEKVRWKKRWTINRSRLIGSQRICWHGLLKKIQMRNTIPALFH
ncbi:hypothetical protein PSH12_11320 [Enterococcus casseliflavus]|nr:hypothetical protein [Enterococcus casseliflavus]MDT2958609.1 hypothetical protein [Enterococcus casseliflavus]MDT2990322.1 hypothetical protein [Enterococcus casseliflavus]MDV7690127.1 hypothetical protein [Enterococcus casseliflavus]MDV7713191.1 hypothetical protein [Enterococcus casseliflavus]